MIRSQALGRPVHGCGCALEWRPTEKPLEAGFGDLRWLLVVDVLLVVLEELIFFECEHVRFEYYLETMCWLGGTLEICIFSLMNRSDEVEFVPLPGLLSEPRLAMEFVKGSGPLTLSTLDTI